MRLFGPWRSFRLIRGGRHPGGVSFIRIVKEPGRQNSVFIIGCARGLVPSSSDEARPSRDDPGTGVSTGAGSEDVSGELSRSWGLGQETLERAAGGQDEHRTAVPVRVRRGVGPLAERGP